jgi:hypothetical protein
MLTGTPQRTWVVAVCMAIGIIIGIGRAVSRRHQRADGLATVSDRDVAEEMRRRASQAVDVAARDFRVTLDFRPESVVKVEEILGKIHDRHRQAPLSDSELVKESMRWGAYVGEVTRGVRPCRWALNSAAGGEGSLPVVYADRSESFPVRWCYKRIKNGEEDNVWHKFTILVIERDRPGARQIGPE